MISLKYSKRVAAVMTKRMKSASDRSGSVLLYSLSVSYDETESAKFRKLFSGLRKVKCGH